MENNPSQLRVAKDSVLLKSVALAIIGSVFLIISAKYKVPFWPVPVTLQTLLVILIPLFYGLKTSMLCISLYLFYGLVGWPVFANGGGPLYFLGPTAGYLYGFLLATFLVGYFKSNNHIKNNFHLLSVILLAEMSIFTLGVAWLSGFIGFSNAIQAGFQPFLIGELFKIVLVVIFYNLFLKKEEVKLI